MKKTDRQIRPEYFYWNGTCRRKKERERDGERERETASEGGREEGENIRSLILLSNTGTFNI